MTPMKGKGGPKSRSPKPARRHQQGGGTNSRPAGGGGGRGGGPHGGRARYGGGGGGGYARGAGGQGRSNARGPIACPMCGEVVANLAAHIRTRHDDPASHPRE